MGRGSSKRCSLSACSRPSNQSMKPTAPLRNKSRVFATTPSTSSRFPASLVRLKLVHCPHSLAPTLIVLPFMSLRPSLHSLRSRAPAVFVSRHLPGALDRCPHGYAGHVVRPTHSILFNDCRDV